jgi:hypothetical protein
VCVSALVNRSRRARRATRRVPLRVNVVDFTAEELDTLLAALFELRITHTDDTKKVAMIESLVWRLGRDPDAALFGADDT